MRVFSRRGFIVVAGAFLIAGPAVAQLGRLQTFDTAELGIRSGREIHRFHVEVATTPAQHTQGLMFRRQLAPDAGMLFIYSPPKIASMWMKNTFIPLDMVFIDGNGRIVGIAERAIPGSLEVISSNQPITGVLELNGGTAARLRIAVGDRVIYPAFNTGSP